MEKKNTTLAFVLNLLLPGIGYIYNGKRIVFGVGVLLYTFLIAFFLPLLILPTAIYFAVFAKIEAEKISKGVWKKENPELFPKNLGAYILACGLLLLLQFASGLWMTTTIKELEKIPEKEAMKIIKNITQT
jgi:TM2 domain-containing membrane protein YozV